MFECIGSVGTGFGSMSPGQDPNLPGKTKKGYTDQVRVAFRVRVETGSDPLDIDRTQSTVSAFDFKFYFVIF